MPALGTVTALARDDLGTAGDYLRAVRAGECDPADIVVVPVDAGGEVVADDALDSALAIPAKEIVAAAGLTGKAGQHVQAVVRVGDATVRVVFVGVADRSPGALRRAGAEIGRLLRPGEEAVTAAVTGRPADEVRAFTEGIVLGSYRYSEKSAADQESAGPAQVLLLATDGVGPEPARAGSGPGRSAIGNAVSIASAAALARDLSNTPSVRKSPQWLADRAADAVARTPVTARVWSEDELAEAGFGGIVAVGSGSERPPRLIELRYEPAGAQRHVALIGKGITFDSGGLSLKPNDGMKMMKTDMAGGAAVIAVMSALAGLGVRHRVTGLIAAAENMPSGSAYRPGDVLTAYNGRTIEVVNTDAEGRLVLADAIAYAGRGTRA
jgi:leucyl aminopeptidase